jgi:serine/threonine-protein kinase
LLEARHADTPRQAGRYRILGRIAQGGMGQVLKGHDPDLGRDLAVKVLLPHHDDQPEFLRRFLEEAQISGQLQHPGVVPVHELGHLHDGRPFFAMKLVEGRTLADLLAVRPALDHDLPAFLKVFEQVCQTVAYAHSRGVIHRDLKPSNIMVGAFGEVQVMDWGLAKVLGRGAAERSEEEAAPAVSEVRTLRSEQIDGHTQAGWVLGTPEYMAPEQARAEAVDERVDVFGLGAILCEILTGQSPYGDDSSDEAHRRASCGDLDSAWRLLDGCGADADLVGLARACLEADPVRRLRAAREVARGMTAYLTGVQERLRAAELERTAAEARAVEARAKAVAERRAGRFLIGLVAATLLGVAAAGTGYGVVQRERRQTAEARARRAGEIEAKVGAALQDADQFVGQARSAHANPALWEEHTTGGRAALKRARDLLGESEDHDHLHQRHDSLARQLAEEERDCRMVVRLDDIRMKNAEVVEGRYHQARIVALYEEAFRNYGIDVLRLTPTEVGARVRSRTIRARLVAALDDWSGLAFMDRKVQDRLFDIANRALPNSWRGRFYRAAKGRDLAALDKMVDDREVRELPASSLLHLAGHLVTRGRLERALALVRHAHARYPADFWINYTLAKYLDHLRQPPRAEVLRFYTAAAMLRPHYAGVHVNLSNTLSDMKRHDEAIAAAREALKRRPGYADAYLCLGKAYSGQGKLDDALAAFRKALAREKHQEGQAEEVLGPDWESTGARVAIAAVYQKQKRLAESAALLEKVLAGKPRDALPRARHNLAVVYWLQGKHGKAIHGYRELLAHWPNSSLTWVNLGHALVGQKQLAKAADAYRRAIALGVEDPGVYRGLAEILLRRQGRADEAIPLFRKALALEPSSVRGRRLLADALIARGRLDEAAVETHKVLAQQPDHPRALFNLALFAERQGRRDDAIAAYKKALATQPDFPEALCNLGGLLVKADQTDEAIAAFRKAVEQQADHRKAHFNLGLALRIKGLQKEALASFRTAIRLGQDDADVHLEVGLVLQALKDCPGAVSAFRKVLARRKDDVEAQLNLGAVLMTTGKPDQAIPLLRAGLGQRPRSAAGHCNLGTALWQKKRFPQAQVHFERALDLNPGLHQARYNLGNIYWEQGMLDLAAACFRAVVSKLPDHAEAHCNLGLLSQQLGQFADAARYLRRGHKLGSSQSGWRYPSADWLRQAERLAELDARLPAILRGVAWPARPRERLEWAFFCQVGKQYHAAAAGLFVAAFTANPAWADDLRAGNRFRAACSAVLAGCGQGKDSAGCDDRERARWRQQGLAWLRADLTLWEKRWKKGTANEKAAALQALRSWLGSKPLAGVRDAKALPKAERANWRKLWQDVERLQKAGR